MRSLYKNTLLILSIILISCGESSTQTIKDEKEFRKIHKKENTQTFFLGAIKLCIDTPYDEYFNNPRTKTKPIKDGNCCAYSVPSPYINLSEYYLYAIEENRAIFDNRNNPFNLKKVRKDLENKIDKVRDQANKVNINNLTYIPTSNYSIEYDFNSEKIRFSSRQVEIYFNDLHKINFQLKDKGNYNLSDLSLPKEEAEELFENFEKNKKHPNLPSVSSLTSKITYSLEKSDKNDREQIIIVDIKKIEFYYPYNWDKKVGEIVF